MTAVDPRPPDTGSHRQVQDLARLLDSRFRVPGTGLRFGVDGLLGLVPGVGDAAGLALSTYVIAQAVGLGARGSTVGRMVANVVLDAVFGSIPVLGWAWDFWFKANNRNVALLERHGLDPGGTEEWSRRSLRRTVVAVVVGTVVLAALLLALVAWLVAWLI
jgi:hypothetical protein